MAATADGSVICFQDGRAGRERRCDSTVIFLLAALRRERERDENWTCVESHKILEPRGWERSFGWPLVVPTAGRVFSAPPPSDGHKRNERGNPLNCLIILKTKRIESAGPESTDEYCRRRGNRSFSDSLKASRPPYLRH